MRSPRVEPAVLGVQEPRVCSFPPYRSSAGDDAVELAAMAGVVLDPWQQLVLRHALGERPDGKWAALEVGLMVPRQNGKGGVLEARELAGLFLLGERLIIHSAHQFDTSLEAFARLLILIEDTPELERRVKRVIKAAGQEGIELKNRQRIRFRTRTKSGGRGFTGDCVILDEAMILSQAMQGALMPTLSARPNPQIWYTGSAVDEEVHEHGVVFAKVRERGIAGTDPRLAYFEWSVDEERLATGSRRATDVDAWAEANPALGIRITGEFIATEQRSMDTRTFRVERLGVGYWPDTSEDAGRVISVEDWAACGQTGSKPAGVPFYAVDVTPNRAKSSIGLGCLREDGHPHVEVVENAPGTNWVVDRCVELGGQFIVDPASPASTLTEEMRQRGLIVVEIGHRDYARACGRLFDLVVERELRYPLPQPELDAALAVASARPLGDAWAWDRRKPGDISPLVAVTLALWGVQSGPGETNIVFGSDVEPAAADPLEELVGVAAGSKGPKVRVLSQADTTVLRVPPRR